MTSGIATERQSVAAIAARSYVALVHYPVYDKNRRVVATSITNLDIHDIARSSRTYGIASYFLVHPVAAQRELASRIVGHWQDSEGRKQNDFRSDALSSVRVASSIEETIACITALHGQPPLVVGTSAQRHPRALAYRELLGLPELETRPLLLLFGTGWGLVSEWVEKTDRMLCPINGPTDYNHLSVRSAAAIILDRLFQEPETKLGEHSV